MANEVANKIIYDGNVLIDLTSDTVDAAHLLKNYTAHDSSGKQVTGSCEYDADTSDANATAADIRLNKTGYVNGSKVTGSIVDLSANVVVTSTSGTSIPQGYSDGSYKAVIDATSLSNLSANNVRSGVTILGVTGSLSPEDDLTVGPVSATPTTAQQVITAASQSLDYITQVTVAAIPYTQTVNAQGGLTITIA